MEFRESHPIYLQIADLVCERILLSTWKPGVRVPSVRDLAIELEVNPNTVMRTYDFLQSKNILDNERGIGLFVAPKALKFALEHLQSEFTENTLPHVFRRMILLQIDPDDLKPYFDKYAKRNLRSLKPNSHEAQ